MSKPMFSMVAAAVAAALAGAPALAQEESAGALTLEEITVTARKTEERLIEAPLSITAFSAADIEKKGFATLEDVARSAPGVQYSNQGGQIPGRYTSAIRFRGMNVNSDSPSLQLGSLFIDGVFVLGGTQSIPYDDIERIEVIKGPQSATYGRSTFGGAINYITRTPSLTDYSGRVNVSSATYSDNDVSASFEGPILQDKVSFRIGGRYYNRGAVFTATDGGGLGEESSKSIALTLNFQPNDALNVKVRGFHAIDDDGPMMGGLVNGWRNDTCTGKTIKTQDPLFPSASPKNYICGAVPELGVAKNIFGTTSIVDQVTTLFPRQAALNGTPNFVYDNLVARPNDSRVDVPKIDKIGLVRTVTRFSVAGTYDFGGGYQVAFQAGKNELKANWIRPFGLTPAGYWMSRDPQDSEDTSYEIRISSPRESKLTWLAGFNSYDQTFLQSGSGGDATWLCFAALGTIGGPCSKANFFTANSLAQNTDKVKTQGIFASVAYQLTDAFSVSLEGRKQKDKTTRGIFSASPTSIEDDSFLPRAIVRWTPSDETNVYASYAKGILPGVINAEIAQATAREAAQYQKAFPGIAGVVAGDKLDMYELGWKQQWLDRRAQTNIAVYWGKWKNQKGRSAFAIQEDCGSFAHGGVAGATAANGCANGPTGLPAVFATGPNAGQPYFNTRNANVPGDSKLSGVEFEGSVIVAEGWDLRGTLTWAKSEYDDFIFNFVQPIAGFTQMKGNSNARFPEWSGSIASGYTAPIQGSEWSWFVNGDLTYVGKTYVDESNLAYCKSYSLTNVRVGGEKGGLRVEAFVKNAFDDDSWAACARWTDFDSAPGILQLTSFQGVAVTPNMPRQFGIRAAIKF
ncbi:MAG: TonB-dependent receptor [Gammaproteobacteria bacterium]|nr:TonB-dependent receptor [Gammaproteobacteria bacterium]